MGRSERVVVLCDLDSVLNNLGEAWVAELNRRHGLSVAWDDIVAWDMDQFFPDLSHDQVYAPLWDRDGWVWDDLTPLPGAVEAVGILRRAPYTFRVVTTGRTPTFESKANWLLKHFGVPERHIIFAGEKFRINGDFMVDDRPDNLIGFKGVRLLFDQPHNRAFDAEAEHMRRVRNWQETLDAIRDLTVLR